MNGRWIRRKQDEHRCQKPHLKSDAPTAQIGDRWECDCGIIYEVTGFDGGMQWDPFPTVIRWQVFRNPAQEHGIYAPGTR